MKYLAAFFLVMLSVTNVQATEKDNINRVLDSLHENASLAKFEEYFNLYSDDAVFIGTDASEIWTIGEFKKYAKPYFDNGNGWTYNPRNRHIYFSPNQNVAWFDELLDNEKLGETRGTGVLVRYENEWKVSQYHLTIPIPNALASGIAEKIQAHKNKTPH
ncbi:protein with SnoaL 3 domain, NTF 2 superfamily [Alteromonas sp. V450]|uniref:nuclear transport factor 2 family protein n=1 Tax=Alteromonas sp. V450 TaxID=1912139 RepID=UPI0008FF4498|nr:nuclear transport factor 2 family protein [Alteromonas sp. V450]OJF69886.1 protein with SnoaL 3 domain, NTF 2 superfamily [Alteromonas sp. V450]